jgi:hypothetical protein
VRPQVVSVDGDVQDIVGSEPPVHRDRVLEVHQAGQRKGKRAIGHELHLQREAEDVRIGVWQHVTAGEPAQVLVGQQVVPIDRDCLATHRQLGKVPASPLRRGRGPDEEPWQ